MLCSDFLNPFGRFKELYTNNEDFPWIFCLYAMFLESLERAVRSFLRISRISRDMAHEMFEINPEHYMNFDQTGRI